MSEGSSLKQAQAGFGCAVIEAGLSVRITAGGSLSSSAITACCAGCMRASYSSGSVQLTFSSAVVVQSNDQSEGIVDLWTQIDSRCGGIASNNSLQRSTGTISHMNAGKVVQGVAPH